jgi:hypothetical protein
MLGDKKDITIIDILLVPKKNNTGWLENKKKELEDKEHSDCTFKPKTLNYQGMGQREETHGDKCLDLFSRVKKE